MAIESIRINVNLDSSKAETDIKVLQKELEKAAKRTKQFKNAKITFNISDAKKNVDDLNRMFDDTAKNIKEVGKNAAVNIDIKQAEAQIKKLEREIDGYQKKLNALNNGKFGEYVNQSEALDKSFDDERSRTTSQTQLNNVNAMANKAQEQLENQYAKAVEEAERYAEAIDRAKVKQNELKQQIEAATQAQHQQTAATNSSENSSGGDNGARSTAKWTERFKQFAQSGTDLLKKGLRSAGSVAKNVCSALKTGIQGAVSVVKKLSQPFVALGRTIKNKITNGLKQGLSHLKNMGKSADSMKKKFLGVGLALVGMRSAMAGIRQLVSSALSDNEELNNQLTAIKGVMGQVLVPVIKVLLNGLSQIVTFADRLYQIFTGTSLIAEYNAQQTASAAESTEDAADAAEEYKRQMAGFDVANTLADTSSSSSSSNDSDTASLFQATDISSWLQNIIDQIKAGDWYGVGSTIAEGINSVLSKIDWTSVQNKVNTFCKNLGEAVNGFVDALDWDAVGNAVGEGINTITGGINTLVDTINWENLGTGLATSMNGIVDKIDGEALGKTLSAKLKILTNTLYGFFNGNGEDEGFNFANLGTKIGDTVNGWFNNIEWDKVGSNITSFIVGLGDTLSSAADTINWNDGEDSITQKIKDFFANIEWGEMLTSAFTALGKVLGGLGSTVVQLLKDAWNSWKSTYIDPAVEEAGGNIIVGVFNGIVNWLKNVGTWLKENIFDPFIEGFKSTFDIHSPSTNEDILELGKNLIIGVFNGIVNWIKNIKTWFQDNVFSKITEAWEGMKELTISIGGKIKDTFTKAKEQWDNIKETGKEALSTIKGSIASSFSSLKEKWDSISEKGKSALSTIKGTVNSTFSTLKTKWDSIKAKTTTSTIKGSVASAFTSAKSKWDAIKNKTITATMKAKDSASSVFKNIANTFIDYINKAINKINSKLKITISSTLAKVLKAIGLSVSSGSYQIFTIPTIPKLARGGIVNNPGRGVNIIAGENGSEAVLPLENHTGWMDTLAEKISSSISNQNQVVIPIYFDGKLIAKYIIDMQNQKAFMLNQGGAY